MRVNIYNEEITGEVGLVSKTASDTGITYYGVRIFLSSPDVLHGPESGDDDRSAVTLWIGNERKAVKLGGLLRAGLIEFAEREERRNEIVVDVPLDPNQPGVGG